MEHDAQAFGRSVIPTYISPYIMSVYINAILKI